MEGGKSSKMAEKYTCTISKFLSKETVDGSSTIKFFWSCNKMSMHKSGHCYATYS
jgi:hypothetical protein